MNRDQALSPIVLKIGGSLLDLPDLPVRVSRLLAELRNSRVAIVAGGGAATDVVRDWDRRFGLGESASHWLALRALRLSDALLERQLPGTECVMNRDSLASVWSRGSVGILAMESLLLEAESRAEPTPPESWDVTTDSLAAWAAVRLCARLVLAKSVDVPRMSLNDATAAGLVDRWFSRATGEGLCVDWVNLRSPEPRAARWLN